MGGTQTKKTKHSVQDRLKKLEERQVETLKKLETIESHIKRQQIVSFIKFLIIFIPFLIGFLLLIPAFNNFVDSYTQVIDALQFQNILRN